MKTHKHYFSVEDKKENLEKFNAHLNKFGTTTYTTLGFSEKKSGELSTLWFK
jgi:hypothetical protein